MTLRLRSKSLGIQRASTADLSLSLLLGVQGRQKVRLYTLKRGTSSNTSYTTKIHLPRDTFADQMEYLSIHEPCEVQPRLPKETTLKELGLSWIWMTMACGTTKDHAVGHCNLPSSEEIRAPWSIKWGKKTSLTENKLTPLSSRGWVFNSFIFCEQYRAPRLTILSTWDPALPLFKNIS